MYPDPIRLVADRLEPLVASLISGAIASTTVLCFALLALAVVMVVVLLAGGWRSSTAVRAGSARSVVGARSLERAAARTHVLYFPRRDAR